MVVGLRDVDEPRQELVGIHELGIVGVVPALDS